MILQATMRQSGDVTILDLEGRATIGPANDLLAAELARLIKGGARKLLVNLRGVKQVDSSSISTLVRTFVSMQSTGGSLKLLSPQGRVRAVLGLTRLLNVIPNFDDEAAALASFR
ncbi:MAG: STAS domain-containing protein [Acidobacteria bacterium]|nr:STAS domain-containing protein [Acidobacteriota bacterium]